VASFRSWGRCAQGAGPALEWLPMRATGERTEADRLRSGQRPPPDPVDFLDIDALLSDEERLIRDTVRRWVQERVLPNIAQWFEEGHFPIDVAKELAGMGLLGMHLKGYGCAGANAVSYGLACLELEAGDAGFRSFVSVQGSLAMFPIWRFGSEEQKQEWLPRMAAGEAIGCFGLTEPDFGSDPAGMRTSARRDGTDWTTWPSSGPAPTKESGGSSSPPAPRGSGRTMSNGSSPSGPL
jgi:alkylation response protein AidB-like acyl-CoA dehydrogenase